MIFIGDIAGQYNALLRLVRKLPDDKEIVLLGDLVDRGPHSREVVEWAMKHEANGVHALMGNHEHMMIDWYQSQINPAHEPLYPPELWFSNGGLSTLRSYGVDYEEQLNNMREHVKWLSFRRRFMTGEAEDGRKWYASHAPVAGWDPDHYNFLWNRWDPKAMLNFFQVYGHNSGAGVRFQTDFEDNKFAVCIDTSAADMVTAFEFPSMKVWQEPYAVPFETEKPIEGGVGGEIS